MPKFSVMVNRTDTVNKHVELEVSAKDEEAAEEKISTRIDKARDAGKLDESFDWEDDDTDGPEIEYEVSEL